MSKEDYDAVKIGEQFDYEEEMEPSNPEYTREKATLE